MDEALSFSQVTLGYGEVKVVEDLSFTAEHGRMTAITGSSGAGKTTLLRAALGGLSPASGSVRILGLDVNRISGRRLAAVRRRLGVSTQDRTTLAGSTVLEHLERSLHATGTGGPTSRRRCEEALELCGIAGMEGRLIGSLSAGEARRADVAASLVSRPDLLLLDEPTANLDEASADAVISILTVMRSAGLGCLVCTHDMDLASAADRIVNLSEPDGR